MSDIHALSGAFAVDALDDLERAAFQRHLATCSICQDEVDGLREASFLISTTCSTPAPAALRARVLEQIAQTRPLAPLPPGDAADRRPGGSTGSRHRAPRRRLARLVAAAAAVVAVGSGIGYTALQQRETSTPAVAPALSAADQVLTAPDAEEFTQPARGGGNVTVVRSSSLNQAVLVTEDLAPAPADMTRELWLKHDNVYIPAGFLDDGSDHVVLLDGDPSSAQAFGLSIEPVSGSTSPSNDIVALLDFTEA